jgi:hypothetical protein
MMNRIAKPLALAAVLVSTTLGGCANVYYDRRDTVAFQAGDTVEGNKVVHIIDPWPRMAANRRIEADGERMQRAAERYRTNKTTPLNTISTTTVAPASDGK